MDKYLEKLKQSIHSTGYVLEFDVRRALETAGWQVISNRYYEDDLTNTPREIDLLAYKSRLIVDVQYYFVLIISCKKSDKENWVFLTTDYSSTDLNTVHYPYLFWSNDKALNKKESESDFAKAVDELATTHPAVSEISRIEHNTFAFQQVDSVEAGKKNDSDIYNSIISTIKAAEYERKYLPKRKNTPSCYFFELVSIFKGRMFESFFSKEGDVVSEIDTARYKNRLIISGQDSVYRVNFYTFDKFLNMLPIYEEMKEAYFALLSNRRASFYQSMLATYDYPNVFLPEIKSRVENWIRYATGSQEKPVEVININYYTSQSKMLISTSTDDPVILLKLNEDKYVKSATEKALAEFLKYRGVFEFSDSLFF